VASSILTTGSSNILIGVNNAITTAAAATANTINIGGTGGSWVLVTGTGTNATEATTLNGTLAFPNIGADTGQTDASVCEDTTAHVLYSGTGTAGICLGTSSVRYKDRIVSLPDSLDAILALKPINFFYKKGHGDNGLREQYGFLAEDMEPVLPKLVGLDKDDKPNSVDILGIVPVAIKGMQEQQKKINDLILEIQSLQKRLNLDEKIIHSKY
jgi:endosialidase-like protein